MDVDAIFSMQAGSRLVHTRVALSDTLSNLAIGIVKHEGTRFLEGNIDISGNAYTYIASWGQQSLNGDNLGMAVLFKRKILQKVVDDGTSYVAVVTPDSTGLDYYFLAAWAGEHSRGIDSQEAFEAYLKTETEKLTLPAKIEFKTPVTGT